ncbi:hypothetical protein LX36DRAFT_657478 [Colletotrichum falcatum]|nr:hypothetical protein LX36DRAFT_657478 [Colletotrichum falcatum]
MLWSVPRLHRIPKLRMVTSIPLPLPLGTSPSRDGFPSSRLAFSVEDRASAAPCSIPSCKAGTGAEPNAPSRGLQARYPEAPEMRDG